MGKRKKKSAAQINANMSPDSSSSVASLPKRIAHAVEIAFAAREMLTDEARLRWLFEFANREDLLELSHQQLVSQYAHIFAFAAKGRTFSSEMQIAQQAESQMSDARAFLFEIREALRSGLRQVIELGRSRKADFVGWETNLDGVTRRVMRGSSAYEGPLRTTFLAAVADVIAEDRQKRIELCPRYACKRFFWKAGGAKYCSRNCADADRQKRWRNDPKRDSPKEQKSNG
jgi:hypothetical protein